MPNAETKLSSTDSIFYDGDQADQLTSLSIIHFLTPLFFVFVPQTPGATRPRRLASPHKLGRAVALASPAAR